MTGFYTPYWKHFANTTDAAGKLDISPCQGV